jgi:hypothetical protein
MTFQVGGLVSAAPGRVVRRLLALALITASGGLFAAACADNESSLFVRGVKAPEDTCEVDCGADGTYYFSGFVDAAFFPSYVPALIVGNQIVPRGDSDVLRTETSRVRVYEAEVRLTYASTNEAVAYGDGQPAEYAVTVAGTIDPGTGSDAGYGCTAVPLIDGGAMDVLREVAYRSGSVDVIASVILRGRTLGGQEVESPEWSYPVNVCFGCRCVNVTEAPADVCCGTPDDPQCEDLDELAEPCPGTTARVDCRYAGTTCERLPEKFGFR